MVEVSSYFYAFLGAGVVQVGREDIDVINSAGVLEGVVLIAVVGVFTVGASSGFEMDVLASLCMLLVVGVVVPF
jgi:hypothetical protein